MLFLLYGNNVQVGLCAFFLVKRILFTYRKNSTKKDNENNMKQNEAKENYVQREQLYTIAIMATNKELKRYSVFIDVLNNQYS